MITIPNQQFSDPVLEYATRVVSGDILAGEKIKQACQRELDDRERIESDDKFKYHFDAPNVERVLKFMAQIPSPTGEKVKLALFQKWIVGELFGWRDERGNRRYHNAFVSLARKNGKSYLASDIEIATLLLEHKPIRGRQILNVANSFDQACLAFNMARNNLNQLLKDHSQLRRRITVQKKEISDSTTDSFIRPLPSKDSGRLLGYNPTTVVIDEYGIAKNRDVVEAIKSGQGQQDNALLCIISTSGKDLKAVMYDDYQIYSKVLRGESTLDDTFIAIYEQDDENEIYKPETWIKSNPIFEVDSMREKMTAKYQADIQTALAQDSLNTLLVFNFNMWRQASADTFISHDDWQKSVGTTPDLYGKEVLLGVDLSKNNDLTSVSWLIPTGDDNESWFADSHSWVGTKWGLVEKEKRDQINYEALEKAGECDITKLDSGVIDYREVFKFMVNMVEKYDLKVRAVCYDPALMTYLMGDFEDQGWPLVEVQQSAKNLSFSEKQFREWIYNGKITHADNKLLAIAVDNAIFKFNSTGLGYIDKEKYVNRIDPFVSLQFCWWYVSTQLLTERKADNDEIINSKSVF